jgi:hypothetical protein
MQTLENQKQIIIEALDLRRVPVARGVLDGQRMEIEVVLQQLALFFRRDLEQVYEYELVGIVLPDLDQTLVSGHRLGVPGVV